MKTWFTIILVHVGIAGVILIGYQMGIEATSDSSYIIPQAAACEDLRTNDLKDVVNDLMQCYVEGDISIEEIDKILSSPLGVGGISGSRSK